ncbi:MAG: hypothetical protein KA765_10455, partial [Thermoflexales bacterium]|nr:hypothetical protein [Thermoflexales bacterium]
MNQRRSMFAAIAVLALLSLVLTSGGALAQSAPTGATMPYAGRLTDPAGQPVADGQYDFVFTLYAAEKDDRAVWTETQLGVSVKSGEVHTTLGAIKPFPATVSDKVDYWLAVSVRGRGETAFTALSPRQALKAVLSAPNAVNALACPHSHFTDAWIGTNSAYGLDVDNRTGTGDGIRAFSGSTTQDFAAIWAENKAVTGNGTAVYAKSVKGTGVWAETTDFIGVVGKATAITDSVNSVGVWGEVNASGQYARGV